MLCRGLATGSPEKSLRLADLFLLHFQPFAEAPGCELDEPMLSAQF